MRLEVKMDKDTRETRKDMKEGQARLENMLGLLLKDREKNSR